MERKLSYLVKSEKIRSALAISFPFLFFFVLFIPIALSDEKYVHYIDRVNSNNGLYAKFTISLILGVLGIVIWLTKILPNALRAIKAENLLELDSDFQLFYNSNFVVKLNKGDIVFLKQSFMNNSLVVLINGKEIVCGEVTYIAMQPDKMVQNINKIINS